MSRVPLKGKPDFCKYTDSEIRNYEEFIQNMLFAYSEDAKVKEVLKRIHKDLSDELIDRVEVSSDELQSFLDKKNSSKPFRPLFKSKKTAKLKIKRV